MRLKTLPPSHLDSLVDAGKRIFVLNTSSLPGSQKGSIIVNFIDGSRKEYFQMPPTFIPVAVSDSIPARRLTDSRDFKQCLLKGVLTLVDTDDAEAFLETPDALEESDALIFSKHSNKAQNRNVNQEVKRGTKTAHTGTGQSNGPIDNAREVDTVSNRVRAVVEGVESGEDEPKEALLALKRQQSALSRADFSYVKTASSDRSLTKWAKSALVQFDEDQYEYDYEEDDEEEVYVKAKAKKKKVAAKTVRKKKKKVASKPSESAASNASAFDFGRDEPDMTPEERLADEMARAKAMSQQATRGESRISEELEKIARGEV